MRTSSWHGPGRKSKALGGIAAQASQAGASLCLQLLVVRLLGLENLGFFALFYSVIILATAVSSGFVGDSLTVWDRQDLQTRATLQWMWLAVGVSAGLTIASTNFFTGLVDIRTGIAFAAATVAFVMEDSLRRLLMANMNFWRIVLIDMAGLAVTVAWVVLRLRLVPELSQADFLWGLFLGQAVAALVAGGSLPHEDKWFARWWQLPKLAVLKYGAWRALQQIVRPSQLATVRLLIIVVVSAAAAGLIEAARIYIAPAMVIVGGLSSVLFATYARSQDQPLRTTARLADRSVTYLLVGTLSLCGLATAFLPWLAPVITGGQFDMSVVAVGGWGLYAAAMAVTTPYGQLLAVRGRHVLVFIIRLVESLIGLACVAIALLSGIEPTTVPLILAVTSALGAVVLRYRLSIEMRVEMNDQGVFA